MLSNPLRFHYYHMVKLMDDLFLGSDPSNHIGKNIYRAVNKPDNKRTSNGNAK